MNKKDIKNHYFIKDLENMSGIKAHTIRIWEQRYKILVPQRTQTGVRFYDEEQLNLIINISKLLKNGLKISNLALMSQEEIAVLCQNNEKFSPLFEDFITEFLKNILNFEEDEALRHLSFYHLKNGYKTHVQNILLPLTAYVYQFYKNKTLKKVHIDLINQIVSKHLYQIFTENNSDKNIELLILKSEENSIKFDGLIWKKLALDEKKNSVIINQFLEVKELEVLKFKNNIKKILIANQTLVSGFKLYLHKLQKLFPNIEIAHLYSEDLKENNITFIKTVNEFEEFLRR